MTPEQKKWIDHATYYSLLSRWRYSKIGDPIFQGEAGEYFAKVMEAKRIEIGSEKSIQVSKAIGWDN